MVLLSAVSSSAQEGTSARPHQITISVGFGPGGGFDLYCRFLARYMGQYLPSRPTMIVQNVPGAGSIKLANILYSSSPKDGSAIGMVAQTLPVDQLLGGQGISFDFFKFGMIGRMATSQTLIISRSDHPVRNILDVRTHEVTISTTGPSSEATILPAVLNNIVKTRFKLVMGYPGTNEMVIALERKEVDATSVISSSYVSQFARLADSGAVRPLVLNSLQRSPMFKDVPTTLELATDDKSREVMRIFAIGGDVGRSIIAPPGLAQDRLEELQRAFMDVMRDQAFIKDIEQGKLDLDPLDGKSLQKMIESVGQIPPDILKSAAAARSL
jgi:tripartite-type tricarboxylate transporter receptor subunit TctC